MLAITKTCIWKSAMVGNYEVSNDGLVRHQHRRHILSPYTSESGYLKISLEDGPKRKNHFIHRLVLRAFCGPCPKGLQVNHKDGVKANNCVENLEYVTCKENHQHARAMGLYDNTARGERIHSAKLTESDVIDIRKKYRDGSRIRDITKKYPVCEQVIWSIVHRKTWKHV